MLKLGRKRAAFLLCCLLLSITPLKAETTVVEIVDYRDGQEAVLQTFSTLKSAADYYAKHRHDESVVNLGVRQDGKLIAVDQGIVFFASEGCKVNTEYKDADTAVMGQMVRLWIRILPKCRWNSNFPECAEKQSWRR